MVYWVLLFVFVVVLAAAVTVASMAGNVAGLTRYLFFGFVLLAGLVLLFSATRRIS